MSKKLIALVSTQGKTPEQLTEEAWEATKKYQAISGEKESLSKDKEFEVVFLPTYRKPEKPIVEETDTVTYGPAKIIYDDRGLLVFFRTGHDFYGSRDLFILIDLDLGEIKKMSSIEDIAEYIKGRAGYFNPQSWAKQAKKTINRFKLFGVPATNSTLDFWLHIIGVLLNILGFFIIIIIILYVYIFLPAQFIINAIKSIL
jgi:hypothetical protein